MRTGPLRLVAQHPRGEADGIFDADTAVAERPGGTVEEAVARSVVQINAEMVREDELDEAERVVGARSLSEAEAGGDRRIRPVDGRRVVALAVDT